MLTPKGAIVTDAWVLPPRRHGHPGRACEGHAAALEIFGRTLPPRLARAADLTGEAHGGLAARRPRIPGAGQVGHRRARGRRPDSRVGSGESAVTVALAPETRAVRGLSGRAGRGAGAAGGPARRRGRASRRRGRPHAARILAGWPALGAEIDERTLPQEVRYDEIGGVSYTKGCYTGQETVARLHFRGHTNRELRGLWWRGRAGPAQRPAVARCCRASGRSARCGAGSPWTDRAHRPRAYPPGGGPGREVIAGGRRATVVALPFRGGRARCLNTAGPRR